MRLSVRAGVVALALASVLAAACAFSTAPVDEGDALVRLVSEKLKQGQDWRQVADDEDAVASARPGARKLQFPTMKTFQTAKKSKPRMKPKATSASRSKAKAKQSKSFGGSKAKAAGSDSDKLQGKTQKSCSWQAYVNENMWNVAYPDTQAVYQVLVQQRLGEVNILRVTGTFPHEGVKYFSFQSNNKDVGFPLYTIKDYEIEPDAGSGRNPFMTDSDEKIGTYTIHFTPRGDQGLINEVALCPPGASAAQCRDITAVILMRIYTSDPDRAPANSKLDPPVAQANPRLFGYEAPPKVEVRKAKSAKREKWGNVPTCDQTRPTLITNLMKGYFSKLIPPFPDPPRYNRKDGFEMYLGEDTSNAGVFPNLDASYLLAATWQGPITAPGEKVIAKVTGILPMTARNLGGSPAIANYLDYDVRYASFSTIAMVEGGPTCDTLDDAAFIRFYQDRPGWNEHRAFSFVAAGDPTRTCGLYDPKEDLFLASDLDGAAQDFWGLLYRQLVPKTARTQEPDHSNAYARLACGKMADSTACLQSSVLEGVMGDFYPHLEYYTCNEQGELKPLTNPAWFK